MCKTNQETTHTPTFQELKELIKQCIISFVSGTCNGLAELFTLGDEIRATDPTRGAAESKHLSQLLLRWPRFTFGNLVLGMTSWPNICRQEMAEKQETIEGSILLGEKGSTKIDLAKMEQTVGAQTYDLGDTMVKISSSETKTRYIEVFANDGGYPMTVYLGGDSANKQLLLSFDDTDDFGVLTTDNIEDFSMLSAILKDGKDSGAYVFTCFSKWLGVAFTEVLPSLNDAKLPLKNIEDTEITDPQADLLDGCYYYIKNMDAPLTNEQKQFFVSYQPTKTPKMHSEREIAKMVDHISSAQPILAKSRKSSRAGAKRKGQ